MIQHTSSGRPSPTKISLFPRVRSIGPPGGVVAPIDLSTVDTNVSFLVEVGILFKYDSPQDRARVEESALEINSTMNVFLPRYVYNSYC